VTDLRQTGRLAIRTVVDSPTTVEGTMTGTGTMTTNVLTDEMLKRFDERAPQYDRDNRFFHEDFEELRKSGYLKIAVPEEFGGAGLRLDEVLKLQRKLAYYAGATAVAVNMHLYWTGLAADLWRAGDKSCQWVLEEAGAGKVFAAGHGESGNDLPLLLSTTSATRVDGGWEISGHKIFGSLSPVWDYLGFHSMDSSDPTAPKIVHGFMPRDAKNYRIEPTWDVMGMRATESNDTILDGAFVTDAQTVLVCAAGFAGAGMFQVGIFAWGLLGFAAVYSGIAQRAYDMTIETLQKRSSIALTRSMAYHPEVQHYVAEMRMNMELIDAYLDRTAADWSTGVEHPDWPLKIVATKYTVVTKAYEVVDRALDLSGGSGIFKKSRLEQLFRDSRLGRIHPANVLLTHELVAKMSLGINPDEAPRWG
jgi:alkylation response protein AidB-like acyl-CoA dehydrogenase